ncbi:MAG: N-acetyl-gamma-glutamyl-phosphate reductase [Thermodesulfobacteriota bacterium]|nr:N-acetyl-gamma-glutamyl-phosphate reductase [Thermodesulfobacteriota bacterium]
MQKGREMIRAAVVGGTGYAGAELVRLLAGHPDVEITALTSRQYTDKPFTEVYPALKGMVDLMCGQYAPEKVCAGTDVVFIALPHKLPMALVPDILDHGCRVVDLSADFRFTDVALYEQHYQSHTSPGLCKKTVYGLCEVYGQRIKSAALVGNPGCYPTSVLLPLVPLIRAGAIDPTSIIADAKSGVSGAGRSPSLGTHICEVQESFKAYKVDAHRHAPEMTAVLAEESGGKVDLCFVPHLVPMIRGMLSTIYVSLLQRLATEDVLGILADFYKDSRFIRLCDAGTFPETRYVRGSNYCDIGVKVTEGGDRLILVSAIDNLVKGAAGQAVQNMNIMFDVDETAGLDMIPLPV